MARWRQDSKTGRMIPVDEAAAVRDRSRSGVAIHGIFDPFISPVDRTVIHTARQLREHNIRNNVVSSEEFDTSFLERKAKERADHFEGRVEPQERLARRQALYEIITRAENEQ